MTFKRFKSEELHKRGLRARDAFRRIRRAWTDWTEEIGPCFMDAKQAAFHLSGTNDVKNPAYSVAMSEILIVYELQGLPETTRADLIYVMENLPEINEWREKADNGLEMNNPSTVRRAYDKHLQAEVAARIKKEKEDKAAAEKARMAEPGAEAEYEVEEGPDEPSDVAARDEASDDRDYEALLAVASAELKEKEAEIERLSTFRTEHDEFTPSTPFSEQLKLRVLGLTVLITDDSLFQNLTERKKKQREAVIKELGELQRALLILLEPEAVRPTSETRQS